ncbi:ABC-three component system protein [Pseudomonas sp.]|uniref:ABC-three component system protein n=1 Tax=Pseudomonas sp. TaxID=306 RepID=UPI003C7266C4
MAKNEIEAKLPHTAVAVWGGYIYQGKIALYHCLSLILKNLIESAKLSLQLDSIDDFAILLNGECKSIHQVKAYKSDDFSSYESAISEQKEKSTKYPNCEAFFHVSKMLKVPEKFSTTYSPVVMYRYNKTPTSEEYCALSEIDNLLENALRGIYTKYHSTDTHKVSNEYLSWSRNLLEDIVVKKVIAMHSEIQLSTGAVQRQVANREKIEFTQFLEILSNDLTSAVLCEDYFFSIIMKDIGSYFANFCEEHDLQGAELSKLSRCIAEINRLDIIGLKAFICSILPDKKGRFSSLTEYKDEAITSDDLQLGLFRIFHELIESNYDASGKVKNFYWRLEGKNYYPTAIHQGPSSAGSICKRIVEGSIKHDVEFLYESGTLITLDINAESIYSVVCVGARSEQHQEHSKFNKFKEISLISISNLPKEIKK